MTPFDSSQNAETRDTSFPLAFMTFSLMARWSLDIGLNRSQTSLARRLLLAAKRSGLRDAVFCSKRNKLFECDHEQSESMRGSESGGEFCARVIWASVVKSWLRIPTPPEISSY
jgi:hypothetical protein